MTKFKCFSYTGSLNKSLKMYFSGSGLRPVTTDLGDGTTMHCWVPKKRDPARPDLVLIHGFGPNSMWQYSTTLPALSARFNVYVPDLVFFGKSFTTRPERSEAFQARCVKRALEAQGIERAAVVGLSYGGFVAYSLTAQFPESVERLVICGSGVCMEEKDFASGLILVGTVDEAAEILIPQTVAKAREMLKFTFSWKALKWTPAWLLEDFIDKMCVQHVEERKQLLEALVKDRKISDIPKISQQTLIVWGDKDQIFPMELADRLKRHIGENVEVFVIKNAGHAFIIEQPRKFNRRLKAFLLNRPPENSKTTTITKHSVTNKSYSAHFNQSSINK